MKHSVTVDDNITPVTQEIVPDVDSGGWGRKHSLGQLTEELSTLQNRLIIAHEMNKPEMARQIERGISLLQAVIDERARKEGIPFL